MITSKTLNSLKYSLPLISILYITTVYSHGVINPSYIVTQKNKIKSQVKTYTSGRYRYIVSNGIPSVHGIFPDKYDRNYIMAQKYKFRMPIEPRTNDSITPLNYCFGITVEGVPLIPFDAEWWKNDPSSGWHFVALAKNKLSPNLGIDHANGHVHPIGVYHYHGLSKPLLQKLSGGTSKPTKMILVGYAADGFPIYGKYGYADANSIKSPLIALKSSYQLKQGNRPKSGPPGKYDGTFIQDYQYVKGSGNLDQCNGRYGVTPDFPNGTYYYVMTESFPHIGRCFRGTPDKSFSAKAMFLASPTQYSICSTLRSSEQRYLYGCPECREKMAEEQRKTFCPKGYIGR